MSLLAGIDIGGTKCAVSLGKTSKSEIDIFASKQFPTPASSKEAMTSLVMTLVELANKYNVAPDAIGISCGGPLDSQNHRILSPPNLPGWDDVDVLTPLRSHFAVPIGLQNDANAGALAEWQWGAGIGCNNMIFLTFGTGMGAGLILNGRLYGGTNDMAGEIGHVRLAKEGPVGYNKPGSFEGFCSGGGIAQLAQQMAERHLLAGGQTALCPTLAAIPQITAESVGKAAQNGDALAKEVYQIVGYQLGIGVALLVDLLNPERIIIGGIYGRQQAILESVMRETLKEEALAPALGVCEIVPAGLGEHVGDYAALAVAQSELDS